MRHTCCPFCRSFSIAAAHKCQVCALRCNDPLKSKGARHERKTYSDGFHSVTPYVTVKGAAKTIDFLRKAFGAELAHDPIKRPDGSIMHATIRIANSNVMLAEESEHAKATPATLYLYVPNVDAVYQLALKAGGKSVMEPSTMFYGDRSGAVKDPSGNTWFVATHIEEMSTQELQKRAEAFYKQQKNKAA